jgi:hypothetical protein
MTVTVERVDVDQLKPGDEVFVDFYQRVIVKRVAFEDGWKRPRIYFDGGYVEAPRDHCVDRVVPR